MTKSLYVSALAVFANIASSFAADHQILVKVKGMVCESCVQKISKKLSADPAVSHVDVSLQKRLVALDLKAGQGLSNERIARILKSDGFTVEDIQREK
jgi:copper chaperone CopZ